MKNKIVIYGALGKALFHRLKASLSAARRMLVPMYRKRLGLPA
jgi:hypothetical protein